MRAITYIRFATYAMILVAVYWVFHWPRVIPARLWCEEEQVKFEAQQDWWANYNRIKETLDAIPRRKDFRETRMSGSQVIAIAIATIKSRGYDLKAYSEPEISLGEENGKMLWYVHFGGKSFPYIGGDFVTVVIDDRTGQTDIPLSY